MARKQERTASLGMMTYIPLRPSWYQSLAAYQAQDARIVRACLNMLTAAFHGEPAGTLPDTMEDLAVATQLSATMVREHYATLTQGWERSEKYGLVFPPMSDMAERLHKEHTQALARLQDATLIAMQAPDLFNSELLPEQGATLAENTSASLRRKADALADTKIKRKLPQGAQLTPTLTEFLLKQGFSIGVHEEIWHLFSDYHRSRSTTSASWASEFRNWLMNQIRYGKLTSCSGAQPAVFKAAMPAPESQPRPTFSFSRATTTSVYARGEAIEAQASQTLAAAQHVVRQLRESQSMRNHG